SLSILVITQNLISLVFGDATRRIRRGFTYDGVALLNAHLSRLQVLTIACCITIAILLLAWEHWSQTGLLLRVVATDPELSEVIGVNNERIFIVAFGLGSALTAVAGVLAAYDTDLTPTMGFRATLMGVVAALIGGIERSSGALLAGLLLGVAQHC